MLENAYGFSFEINIILRMVFSVLSGAVVGYERRKLRQKEAGIRTHCMVALGAAIFTIVSQYGFQNTVDIAGGSVDVSRVAANIVNGVSFLGAGIIFVKNKSISGLTTAAGIWAVAALGTAFGSGMFCLGIVATLLIFIVYFVLHDAVIKIEGEAVYEYTCVLNDGAENVDAFTKFLYDTDPRFKYTQIDKKDDGSYLLKFTLSLKGESPLNELLTLTKQFPYIRTVSK